MTLQPGPPDAGPGTKAAPRGLRVEVVAALGLACVYLAVMSGHFESIDGLVMWRQALSITYHLSWSFVPPIWWGSFITSSSRGIGASFQYIPSLFVFRRPLPYTPADLVAAYDSKLLYGDRLYTLAGAPVWAAVTALAALIVGLTARMLTKQTRASLWAMAFFGLGSPALVASRGDWPQPLVALCWVGAVFACLRFNENGRRRWLWVAALALFYGVLTRPLEGSLLLPAVLVVLLPAARARPLLAVGQVAAWAAAVLLTVLTNWARFGSPLNFGYPGSISWSTPIWVGFPYALLSPGRGELWAFPALALAVVGAVVLWRSGRPLLALTLGGLPAVLFIESCMYFAWIGGWDWGFRLFQPALPLVAVMAGLGAVALRGRMGVWLPALLLTAGVMWNIPAVATDLLDGYAPTYDNLASWSRLDAYPPIGAWQFLHHVLPTGAGSDSGGIDIVWFRATRTIGKVALLPFVTLLGIAGALWVYALRIERRAAEPAG